MLKKLFPYLVSLIAVIATGVRTWQLTTAIDQSGFYLEQYQVLCNAVGIAVIGLVVLLIVLGRIFLKPQGHVAFEKKNPVLGCAGLLLSIATILQGSADYATAETQTMGTLAFGCCLFAALGFAVIGVSFLQGKTAPFVSAALPVGAGLGCLVLQYANFNGISKISENVIFILFICSFLAFTLTQCRVITGINSPKGMAFGFGTAAATALFGLCVSVPHWGMVLVGTGELLSVSFLGFGAAVYALVYLFQLSLLEPKETE